MEVLPDQVEIGKQLLEEKGFKVKSTEDENNYNNNMTLDAWREN